MPGLRGSDLGDCLSVITWVSVSNPQNGPVSVIDDDQEKDEETEVVYLPVECGLCLGTRLPDDKIIAILGNDDSTLPSYMSKIFRSGFHVKFSKRWLGCQGRKRYTSMKEIVVFHADCYRLFLQNHDRPNPLKSLWTSVAWKYPWRPRAKAIHKIDLEDHDLPLIKPSVATALGMPKLASLPPTILQEIRAESLSSKLWDYSAISNLAERMSMAASQGDIWYCQVHKLDKIEAWERGQPPVKTDSASESKITKLTIDRHGIRKIESLPDWPQYDPWRSESRAYVFIDPTQAKKCRLQFKLGLARLYFDSDGPDFPQIWDTPTPPVKGLSLSPRTAYSLDPRFRTVDLRNTTGITFFYLNRSILRIHSHTASSPTALETYRRFPATIQKELVWAYVPISPNDRILEFGIRESDAVSDADSRMFRKPTVMIRTKLLDDIIIGPCSDNTRIDHLFEFTPHILVYTVPNALGCTTFGAVGKPDPNAQLGNPMPVLQYYPNVWIPKDAIKSHAPLDGAVRIDVFFSANDHTSCKGIILYYKNGAQRAVGLCRIGIDSVTTYRNPVNFRYVYPFYPDSDRLPEFDRYYVVCTMEGETDDHDHDHDHNHDHNQFWNSFPMKGTINYVWNHRKTSLKVDSGHDSESLDSIV